MTPWGGEFCADREGVHLSRSVFLVGCNVPFRAWVVFLFSSYGFEVFLVAYRYIFLVR